MALYSSISTPNKAQPRSAGSDIRCIEQRIPSLQSIPQALKRYLLVLDGARKTSSLAVNDGSKRPHGRGGVLVQEERDEQHGADFR